MPDDTVDRIVAAMKGEKYEESRESAVPIPTPSAAGSPGSQHTEDTPPPVSRERFSPLSDAVELVMDEFGWDHDVLLARLGRVEADALINLRAVYESVHDLGAADSAPAADRSVLPQLNNSPGEMYQSDLFLDLSFGCCVRSEEEANDLAEQVFALVCGGSGEGSAHVCARGFSGSHRVVDYDADGRELHSTGRIGHVVVPGPPRPGDVTDFFEEDEPVEKIKAILERGADGVITAPPAGDVPTGSPNVESALDLLKAIRERTTMHTGDAETYLLAGKAMDALKLGWERPWSEPADTHPRDDLTEAVALLSDERQYRRDEQYAAWREDKVAFLRRVVPVGSAVRDDESQNVVFHNVLPGECGHYGEFGVHGAVPSRTEMTTCNLPVGHVGWHKRMPADNPSVADPESRDG